MRSEIRSQLLIDRRLLAILITEGILASLSVRATGIDLTILSVGMLIGFATLCTMVFVLAAAPRFRNALLGDGRSSALAIAQMNLTANDVRAIFFAYGKHGLLDEAVMRDVFLGEKPLSFERRLQKLRTLGLATTIPARRSHGGKEATGFLTEEGKALAQLIELLLLYIQSWLID